MFAPPAQWPCHISSFCQNPVPAAIRYHMQPRFNVLCDFATMTYLYYKLQPNKMTKTGFPYRKTCLCRYDRSRVISSGASGDIGFTQKSQ